ncbi:hypothetical protein IFR04_006770 [Cadophora malorum]|uniref:Uncharacterized protein n=1 Tax=Cadophora malorum TaxID=108018 RepID=A0A8H7TJL3_9HELO|nr:hypothetical protein IFR04_006770 [Cadophora malorum]
MKTTTTFALVAAFASAALAQDPGPSPTASVGCEPHGDHWHCDGPVSASATLPSTTIPAVVTVIATTSSAVEDHDHEDEEHDHSAGTGSLAPSPTESVGCVPHGDHWDCDAPASAVTTGSGTATAVVTLAPSPTESIGCEPHGDHWDCEGPAVTSSAVAGGAANGTTSAALSATPSQTFVPSSGVVVKGSSVVTFAGVFALAVAFAL